MDFRQLKSFAAVVEYKSFSKAADKLNSAQPTISTHVRMLEEELQTQLILRTTKSIEITPQGWEAYKYAKKILDLRDCILQNCSADARQIIRVGASTIPATYILPEILHRYSLMEPDSYFVVNQSDSKSVIEGLADGQYDVGLTGMMIERENLTFIPFCKSRTILIAPVNERFLELQQRGNVTLEELMKEPIVLRERGSRKSAHQFLDRMGINEDDLQVVARVNDQETVKNMVVRGMGVSFISEIAARDLLRERRLLKFDLPGQEDLQQMYLVYRNRFGSQRKVEKFIKFLSHYEVM